MELKIGDKVKMVRRGAIDWESMDYTYGLREDLVYTVKECSSDGTSVQVYGSDYWIHPSHFEKAQKFKIGDKVRVIADEGTLEKEIGFVGVIKEESSWRGELAWCIGGKNVHPENELELVSEEQAPEKMVTYTYTPTFSSLESYLANIKVGDLPSLRKESFMQKLSTLPQAIRRAFDKDQKSLYRAGYIDQHGEWTDKAYNEAREDFLKKYLNDNKSEFVDRANEAIELAKEEDCE